MKQPAGHDQHPVRKLLSQQHYGQQDGGGQHDCRDQYDEGENQERDRIGSVVSKMPHGLDQCCRDPDAGFVDRQKGKTDCDKQKDQR